MASHGKWEANYVRVRNGVEEIIRELLKVMYRHLERLGENHKYPLPWTLPGFSPMGKCEQPENLLTNFRLMPILLTKVLKCFSIQDKSIIVLKFL
jgi:hypothetical protein